MPCKPLVSVMSRYVLPVAIVALAAAGRSDAQTPPQENRWEATIGRFEAQDRQASPPEQGILFVGSSSIVGWDVKKHFPDLPVINRGFGGSQIADSVHFAERIVLPYRPKIIVFYAGDNDVASGKSPQRVLADYQSFVAKVHRALPETRIVFIAIKPSISRWQLIDKMREANALIAAVTEKDQRLAFVDVDKPMLGDDGRPRGEIFKDDGLHLNAAGYELWSDLVRPHLKLRSCTECGMRIAPAARAEKRPHGLPNLPDPVGAGKLGRQSG
ncbi:MAG TPA: SGNH/GDSL hydrolase family protein [Thermoguttaceae bacterium]|nr:SGNH/GDSL hydrolase family protein [Thermoguttaceae bacterium]